MPSALVEIRNQRLEKVKKLRDMGIDPYPATSHKDHTNKEITHKFDELNGKGVTVSGRLMSWREHGHLVFGHLQDQSGNVQLYIKDEELQKTNVEKGTLGWDDLNLLDVGDFIEATGVVTKTQRGEISVMPSSIRILTKSLRPLPEKWLGIVDIEERYRRRYLDMTMNPEIRERFIRRAQFWDAIREFLKTHGFIEINIPVLEHVTGGADAKPFVTHYDALDQDFYLRISHELPLKRLLGAGYDKVFDIGPRFRNEGFSDEHLPEHIAMEWYWAYGDYAQGMKFTEEMFKYVLQKVYGKLQFDMKGFHVDLTQEWEKIRFKDVIQQRFGVDIFKDSVPDMNKILKENGVDLGQDINKNRVVDNLWKLIRKDIGGPAFLVDVPKFFSPLTKTNPDDPRVTQRFHPIIGGSELATVFGELNDPVDQFDRFVEQQKMREAGDDEAQMLDIDFVEMLEYGMPPAVGLGLTERVFWFFEDITAKEGVPFPQLKSELDNNTKEIYNLDKHGHIQLTTKRPLETSAKQDFSKKIVIVVSRDLEKWQVANTIAHVSAYLGNRIHEGFDTGEFFATKDEKYHPRNSQYPIVVLEAKPGQMHSLMLAVRESRLLYHGFIKEMIETTNDQEIVNILKGKNDDTIEYLGIGIFGENEKIDKLAKKFSLLK